LSLPFPSRECGWGLPQSKILERLSGVKAHIFFNLFKLVQTRQTCSNQKQLHYVRNSGPNVTTKTPVFMDVCTMQVLSTFFSNYDQLGRRMCCSTCSNLFKLVKLVQTGNSYIMCEIQVPTLSILFIHNWKRVRRSIMTN
jgi:hypothetical protein